MRFSQVTQPKPPLGAPEIVAVLEESQTMNKTALVVALLVVIGGGAVTYSLWRGEPPGSVLPGAAEVSPAPSRTPAPAVETARAANAVAATAETGGAATVDLDAKDEAQSQFGHATKDSGPDQLTTSPEQPAADSEPDGRSLAPALAALNGNLKALLKDAGPDAAAEVAALPGARAAIERLLTDSDPAVREQAAEVLKALSAQAP